MHVYLNIELETTYAAPDICIQWNLRIKGMLGQGVLSFIERFPYSEVKMYWYNRNWDE